MLLIKRKRLKFIFAAQPKFCLKFLAIPVSRFSLHLFINLSKDFFVYQTYLLSLLDTLILDTIHVSFNV